ncbi:hypothetical protein N7470_004472 [Penicillium chermesinum]|nr:hypothetical protein N7470_004472 [Penicillium chermesinum]
MAVSAFVDSVVAYVGAAIREILIQVGMLAMLLVVICTCDSGEEYLETSKGTQTEASEETVDAAAHDAAHDAKRWRRKAARLAKALASERQARASDEKKHEAELRARAEREISILADLAKAKKEEDQLKKELQKFQKAWYGSGKALAKSKEELGCVKKELSDLVAQQKRAPVMQRFRKVQDRLQSAESYVTVVEARLTKASTDKKRLEGWLNRASVGQAMWQSSAQSSMQQVRRLQARISREEIPRQQEPDPLDRKQRGRDEDKEPEMNKRQRVV